MLCHACRVHLRRGFPYCLSCGTLRTGAKVAQFEAPELHVGDRSVALIKPVTTLGRASENDVVLDDVSVSRRHARIVRTEGGFAIEDLDSFNGTTVAGRVLHGDRAVLADETEILVGDVPVRFAQPRALAIGSKTVIKGTEHTLLAGAGQVEEAPTAGGPLSVRPRRRSGWALKRVPDSRGVEGWVLRNSRTDQYLQLDPRDVFIWNCLDGENTMRDLLFRYAEEYGELALPRIEAALRAFASIGLVGGLHGQRDEERRRLLRRLGRAILRALLRLEVSVKGLDRFAASLYRGGGWRFFTRTGVLALWAVILAGGYGFVQATHHQELFNTGGAGVAGAVAVAVGYLLALTLHELAHALAVKSYGRRVTRGGFMLMMGMPFAFVDTSDMWFGSRWSRFVVTLSGPLSTLALAGGCGLVAAYVDQPVVSGVAFQLAFGLYLNSLYNLNPLMPLDGYQALSDGLRQPRLREEATAYFSRGVWSDLRHGRRPRVKQVGLAAYGMFAVIGTAAMVVLGLFSWRSRLGEFAGQYVPRSLVLPAIVAGILLAMFPVWFRLLRRLVLVIGGRRARRRGSAVPTEANAPVEVSP